MLGRVAQGGRLRLAADAPDAGADVDRRLLPRVEQPGVEHQICPSVIEIRLVGM